MNFIHVKTHQDEKKQVKDITLADTLNIKVDDLFSTSTRKPIPTNILNSLIAIYVSNKYIPNKYFIIVRKNCGEIEAK